jgi:hypothetical protein
MDAPFEPLCCEQVVGHPVWVWNARISNIASINDLRQIPLFRRSAANRPFGGETSVLSGQKETAIRLNRGDRDRLGRFDRPGKKLFLRSNPVGANGFDPNAIRLAQRTFLGFDSRNGWRIMLGLIGSPMQDAG